MNIEDLLLTGEYAVQSAGEKILEALPTLEIRTKDDGSLVTNADIIAERKIVSIISSAYPRHTIRTEESGTIHHGDTEYFWAADPLDGTSAAVNQEPNFSVALCLLKQNQPYASFVYNPITRKSYISAINHRTTVNSAPAPTITNSLRKKTINLVPGNPKVMIDFMNMKHDGLVERAVSIPGSPSLNLAMIAEGTHEHYIMEVYKQPNPEDLTPGYLLVTQAGGIVTDLEGKKIDPLRFTGYLVASLDLSAHRQLLHNLKQYVIGEKRKALPSR